MIACMSQMFPCEVALRNIDFAATLECDVPMVDPGRYFEWTASWSSDVR